MKEFSLAYQALNNAQKRAVDAIEGPVMVVAGPGTGKTQVLSLRIAHILQETDTPANGILCLTFTRAGVSAMRERLVRYIGVRAHDVAINTFHSFAIELIEKYFSLLDFDAPPTLLDEKEAVFLIDELLHAHEWQYIRPRGNATFYFHDLTSLISLLKRERITSKQFLGEIEKDIAALRVDPTSISSRGETKGELKKEVQKKIEGLERTREVVQFYEEYEALKKDRSLMDYDDVLEYAVALAEQNEDVRAELKENYLYVLVDEHQDSSGVQNSFLSAVWGAVEKPNIFVVGDDRQLIYGFSGASFSYFEAFKTAFGKATLITLTENYRSTAPILALADELLKSALTDETLKSTKGQGATVALSEYVYPRDEIIAAGLHCKEQIAQGTAPEECALLVPKNRHVRTAIEIFRDMGLPVRSAGGVSLFELKEMDIFKRVLGVVCDPYNGEHIAQSLFDYTSGIAPLVAHKFLHDTDTRNLSLETLISHAGKNLFEDPIGAWGKKIEAWVTIAQKENLQTFIHTLGNELLIDTANDHETLMRSIEVVRTMLHLVIMRRESHPKETVQTFLEYVQRLEEYGHPIMVAPLLGSAGITVSTLHGSKGLEYESVWIAHMNEETLMSQKRSGFALPESLEALVKAKDTAVAKREVYVAITRAKRDCTISYAAYGYNDAALELARIVAELPETHFIKKSASDTEHDLVDTDPNVYVAQEKRNDVTTRELTEMVREQYPETNVSVTLLNNFFECPWKWYFRSLLQLPEEKTERLMFGSAIHSTIETILKDGNKPSDTRVQELIETNLEREGITTKSVLARMIKEGTAAVTRWVKQYFGDLAKEYTSERSISFHDPAFSHLTMYGKIDLTERFPDKTIMVTDFKTGKSHSRSEIEKQGDDGRLSSHLRQLAMYSYLIHGAEKKDVTTSRLLFLEATDNDKNALYSAHVSAEQIDLLKRDIADYDKAIASGEWVHRECHVKPFGRETECEYCRRAREIYGVVNKK
ncbi:MAG TPA: ATP-dependent DNA helicase [Candidatus Paceibacterota bacterium]|nr:ATP-dependent DNA helicase [Candidatus Paceibacterota bacterium]